jgi:hypothetical protein
VADFKRERYCVEQFVGLTGFRIEGEPRDPLLDHGCETGLDVTCCIGGRRVGFQVTEYDGGEGVPAIGGGRLRAREVASMRKSETEGSAGVHGFWGSPHVQQAFTARISAKVAKSENYPFHHYCDEAWLLVSANVPGVGESTFVPHFHLGSDLLDQWTGALLVNSSYARAYFHIIMGDVLFAWDRSAGWQKLIDRRQERMSCGHKGT